MKKLARIAADYEALKKRCVELDEQYTDTYVPGVGFKMGHYDDDRQEIQFYDVEEDRLNELRTELDKAALTGYTKGLLSRYDFYQTHVFDTVWRVLIRPRLLN